MRRVGGWAGGGRAGGRAAGGRAGGGWVNVWVVGGAQVAKVHYKGGYRVDGRVDIECRQAAESYGELGARYVWDGCQA